MGDSPWLRLAVSIALVLGNGFFVASEYALVGSRKSRIDALAKKGNRSAVLLQQALQNLSPYVAGIQIAITMFSIGVGSVAEPFVTELLGRIFGGFADRTVSFIVSFVLVTYVMVVVGELVPKYITLDHSERIGLFVIRPLSWLVIILKPLIWLIERSGRGLAWMLGVRPTDDAEGEQISREELLLLVRSGSSAGMLDSLHAEMVARAMRLDKLDAADVMIHRLDVKWLDTNAGKEDVIEQVRSIVHTRLPLCKGDIDDVVGIVYVNDLLVHLHEPKFDLASIARPAVVVPENLTLDRLVARMRDERTQIVIVVDEYGGTSGLITLEDIVEEIFGELEDSLESSRPQIERSGNRISARADVRYDELLDFLKVEYDEHEVNTDTLATVMINALGRMPKLGDTVETDLGVLRIENMARRRVTRVSLQLRGEAYRT